jgi:hypothetical protein
MNLLNRFAQCVPGHRVIVVSSEECLHNQVKVGMKGLALDVNFWDSKGMIEDCFVSVCFDFGTVAVPFICLDFDL